MAWRNRNRDNAPIGHTCPMIDAVVAFIENIDWANNEEEKALKDHANKMLQELENIRKANTTLRDWGNEQCNLAADYESEVYDLKKENATQASEIQDLKSEIKSLEKEVEQINM